MACTRTLKWNEWLCKKINESSKLIKKNMDNTAPRLITLCYCWNVLPYIISHNQFWSLLKYSIVYYCSTINVPYLWDALTFNVKKNNPKCQLWTGSFYILYIHFLMSGQQNDDLSDPILERNQPLYLDGEEQTWINTQPVWRFVKINVIIHRCKGFEYQASNKLQSNYNISRHFQACSLFVFLVW